jgi:hypothetical protein
MKFGVREICDVVLKAKAPITIGNKKFYKNEPVIYFDSLKTSSMEGAATTVYAQGGKGNSRLIAWEGERTVTFTMEDALISPAGFMILSGAGLIEATSTKKIPVHCTETIEVTDDGILLSKKPYIGEGSKKDAENFIYVMVLDDKGGISTEPYLYTYNEADGEVTDPNNSQAKKYKITIKSKVRNEAKVSEDENAEVAYTADDKEPASGSVVFVDYYTAKDKGVQQIEITADKFGGNYYLEASTLFRNTDGQDYAAEFIIPNCKVQSNFTFTMASSGDPSTFTFTMDAFPDYTRFDQTKKVLAAIQIIDSTIAADSFRKSTAHELADAE